MPIMRKRLNKALLERFRAGQDRERHTEAMVAEFQKGLRLRSGANLGEVNKKISNHSQEAMDAAVRFNRANKLVEEEMFARQYPGAMKWRRAAVRVKVARRALRKGRASYGRDVARLNTWGKRRPAK